MWLLKGLALKEPHLLQKEGNHLKRSRKKGKEGFPTSSIKKKKVSMDETTFRPEPLNVFKPTFRPKQLNVFKPTFASLG